MLLLITGSQDFTSDLLCKNLNNKVFRINFDIFNEYSFEFTPEYWKISNPTGHSISSSSVTSCFWWKAFNFSIENQDNFVIEEVKYLFRELYNWCKLRGLVKGNSYDFHNHIGKLNLLQIASKHFNTPKTLATIKLAGVNAFAKSEVVVKSLSSALTDTKASLLTTQVDIRLIDPKFPWLIQEKIDSDFDITIFVCGKKLFPYEKSRKNLKGLDWRGEQSFDPNNREWEKLALSQIETDAISAFCKDVNVEWGRLDFMKKDNNLVFLEFNANGQWLFLDFQEKDGVLKEVLKYITNTQ